MLRVVLLLVKLALDARGGRDHAEVLEQLRQMLSTLAKDQDPHRTGRPGRSRRVRKMRIDAAD